MLIGLAILWCARSTSFSPFFSRLLPFPELQWQQIMMAVALHGTRPDIPGAWGVRGCAWVRGNLPPVFGVPLRYLCKTVVNSTRRWMCVYHGGGGEATQTACTPSS